MLTEHLIQFSGLLQNEAALALLIFGLVMALISLGIPGVVVPMSVSSGAMLGGSIGMAVVALGALAGSQVLFLVSRRLLKDAARRRIGERLAAFERKVQKHGFYYVLGLRLVGAPHVFVTSASAVTPMSSRAFAAATLLGTLPVVALSAHLGAAF
jgi:uncharacterized membrane protein YdjX (TVP38/TMEM64 family)